MPHSQRTPETLQDDARQHVSPDGYALRTIVLVFSGTVHKLVGLHKAARSVSACVTSQHDSARLFLATILEEALPVAQHLLGR
jgi:hypothetical protein